MSTLVFLYKLYIVKMCWCHWRSSTKQKPINNNTKTTQWTCYSKAYMCAFVRPF